MVAPRIPIQGANSRPPTGRAAAIPASGSSRYCVASTSGCMAERATAEIPKYMMNNVTIVRMMLRGTVR